MKIPNVRMAPSQKGQIWLVSLSWPHTPLPLTTAPISTSRCGCVVQTTEDRKSPQHKAWPLLLAFMSGDYERLGKERRSLTQT